MIKLNNEIETINKIQCIYQAVNTVRTYSHTQRKAKYII